MNLKGVQLGGYRLIDLIGRGGMAEVWLAEQVTLNRKVAIKVILEATEETDVQKQVARFTREAQTLARLDHINILPIIDYGSAQGYLYLVTPFVPGGSLLELLKRNWVTQAQALDITDNILAGLAYAHENGVIHRDLKPGNILLRDDGQAVIADFGVAKIEDDNLSLTLHGMILGSPEYMAPEQFLGQTYYSSDLYSLGVLLYQMITGQLPYRGNSATEIGMRHLNDPIRLPDRRVPEPIAQVLIKAFQKKPANRFATAQDMRAALSQAKKLLSPQQLQSKPVRPQIDEKVASFPTKVIQPKLDLNKKTTLPFANKKPGPPPQNSTPPPPIPASDKPLEVQAAGLPLPETPGRPAPNLPPNPVKPQSEAGLERPPVSQRPAPFTPGKPPVVELAGRGNSKPLHNDNLTTESPGELSTGSLPVIAPAKPRAKQKLPFKIILGGVILLAISVLLAIGAVVFSNKALPGIFQSAPGPSPSSILARAATTQPAEVSPGATTGAAPSNSPGEAASAPNPSSTPAPPTTASLNSPAPATVSPTSPPASTAVNTPSPPTTTATASPTTAPATASPAAGSLQVSLAAANGTAARGTATLTDRGDGTFSVVVNMIGLGQGDHPSHIHQGSCQAEGAIKYELTTLTAGPDGTASATSIIKSNLDFLKSGNFYVDVANVSGDIFYVASCGNIKI